MSPHTSWELVTMFSLAYRVHAAPAPVVEYDAPAVTTAYRVHAAPAPEVTPAPDVAYRVPEKLVEDLCNDGQVH